MLYDGIREKVKEIQNSEFKYKPHIFAYKHVASSQTACVNLFVPIMESESVNDILKTIEACPKDFKCVAKEQLFHGYRFEFWDSTDEKSKGLLGDHSKQAGQGTGQCHAEDTEVRRRTVEGNAKFRELTVN